MRRAYVQVLHVLLDATELICVKPDSVALSHLTIVRCDGSLLLLEDLGPGLLLYLIGLDKIII